MKKTKKLVTLCALFFLGNTALAEEVIDKDNTASAKTEIHSAEVKKTASTDKDGYKTFRIGGYGEAVASFKDYGTNRFYGAVNGNSKKHRNTIAIPRFVLALDYKFTPKWILGAEIEFEAGGTGSAVELENSENGEYETEVEKGGEVAIEQFHITRLIHPAFNVQVGHMVVPFGLTNAHHEPINFFGSYRPEGETTIIPCTWHETGLKLFGSIGQNYTAFDYQLMIVAGLNANGFDRNNWVRKGKQGFFESDNFTSPGYLARIEYKGLPGLRLGGSFYYCANAGSNADKASTYAKIGKVPVRLYSTDLQYKHRYFTLRGNLIYGNMGNSDGVTSINRFQPNASPYSKLTPIAKNAISYGGELGINLSSIINSEKCPVIYPFARYEYYNPQEKMEKGLVAEKRCQVSMWTAGVNWYALPNLVVKADYTTRQIGTHKVFGVSDNYNSENEFSIGIAWVGWFFKN